MCFAESSLVGAAAFCARAGRSASHVCGRFAGLGRRKPDGRALQPRWALCQERRTTGESQHNHRSMGVQVTNGTSSEKPALILQPNRRGGT